MVPIAQVKTGEELFQNQEKDQNIPDTPGSQNIRTLQLNMLKKVLNERLVRLMSCIAEI